MDISVSLPEEDVALLDAVAAESNTGRSEALHHAIELLREARLRAEYAQAAQEWEDSGEGEAWSATETEGLTSTAW